MKGLRIAGEPAIIVVGILVALTADAWLETRKEREAEVRHLEALQDDIIESIDLLDTSEESRERVFWSLVRLLEDDLDAAPVDSVSRWVYDGMFQIASFEPRLTALADLENADQLTLLTPDVRRGIAELNRYLGELSRIEEDFARSQQGMMDPYLVRETPLAPILAVADSLPLSMRLPARSDWSSLRTTGARNAMAFKLSLGKLVTRYRSDLRARMEGPSGTVGRRLDALGAGKAP